MLKILRPLDRYILAEFWKIFLVTALGFPVLLVVIDLTDNLDKYLSRNLPKPQILLSYLYFIPDSMFMVLPAAVLFATVFTVGGFTRHAEITAAKASGISFHRLTLPLYAAAMITAVAGIFLGELLPITNQRRSDLLQEKQFRAGSDRFNFAYAADRGRVYKINALNAEAARVQGIEIERKGSGPDYPTYVIAAEQGEWHAKRGWVLSKGAVHILPTADAIDDAFKFDSMVDRQMRERPIELMATPRAPQDMGYRDLSRFIEALDRSGGDANELKVERALKIAVPITCIIIALFGAPLATSTRRGGAAYGIGVSLATTVIFLVLIQLTKAVGGKGLLPPEFAAWTPNILFGIVGLIMLVRVRT